MRSCYKRIYQLLYKKISTSSSPPLLPSIIAEDQPTRNRRSLLAVTETNQTTITLEFGDPPPLNVSTPEAPSVAQEINMAGETNDSVDLEVSEGCCSTTLDHITSTPDHITSTLDHITSTLDHITSTPGHITSTQDLVTSVIT